MRVLLTTIALLAGAAAPSPDERQAGPQPHPVESVELVCLEHLDVGFTAAPQEVERREKEHLDHAIELCMERPDFRWTVESVWQLEEWLKRTPEREGRERLVGLVREGRIEVAGGFGNLHTGVMDAALMLRCFEPADAIRRELGIEIESCVQDDVPGFSALLPTAMAGSGIRYFLAGVNKTFGGGTSLGPGKNPFWWEGLDGSRVLAWVAYGSYVEAEQLGLGVWSRDGEAEEKLPAALEQLAASGYRFGRVLVMASTGDNGDPAAARSILRKVDAWNAKHARPRILFTTPGALLAGLLREAAAASGRPDGGLPVARGDWSGHWEPVKATAPAGAALFREAQALLPGAEALALRASGELGLPYPQHDFEEALRRLLLCAEHTRPGGVGWPKLTAKADVEAAALFDFEQAFGAAETLRGIVRHVTGEYGSRLAAGAAATIVANPTPLDRNHGSILVAPFALARAPPDVSPNVGTEPGASDGTLDPATPSPFAPSLRWLLPLEQGGRLVDPPAGVASLRVLDGAEDRTGWLARVDLGVAALDEERPDPLRFLFTFGGLEVSAAQAETAGLEWTTGAGVLTDDDFLPGGNPLTRCTTGAIRIELPPAGADGGLAAGPPREAILLTRQAFGFQVGEPRWLGSGAAHASGPIWIHALDLPLHGETRDEGRVRFDRLEPAPDDHRDFHLALRVRPVDPALPAWRRRAELVRAALAWRCPLVTRRFDPWFPSPPTDIGTQPLVEVSVENVLVLQLRPAPDRNELRSAPDAADPRRAPGQARRSSASAAGSGSLLLQLEEIGGAPATGVEVSLALPGPWVARECDLLGRLRSSERRPAAPLRLELAPHAVATFLLSHE